MNSQSPCVLAILLAVFSLGSGTARDLPAKLTKSSRGPDLVVAHRGLATTTLYGIPVDQNLLRTGFQAGSSAVD